jgi:hypothetical protein
MLVFHGQSSASTGIGSSAFLPGLSIGSAAAIRFTNDSPAATTQILISRVESAVLGIKASSATTGAALEFAEMTAPATPSTDRARAYFEDNGSGKTRFVIKWQDGTTTVLATQP